MIGTRFSNNLLAGALSAGLLAGCSAGSQFTPPSAGPQQAGFHQATTGRGQGVSPDSFMVTFSYTVNGKLYWWYYNIWGQWVHGVVSGIDHGSNLGGSATQSKQLDVATTDDTIGIYENKKLTNTLTGLGGSLSGVGTDSLGDTFAAANVSGAPIVEEFAAGSDKPTATYADQNLASVASLAVDKENRVYVEGQSASGGGIEVDQMAGSGSFETLAKPGTLGATAGGLAVQMHGKTAYVWINDLGNASESANIARYEYTPKGFVKQGSFEYSGTNGAIAVDPTGKDTTDVYAVNNVAAGSQYSVSGIDYSFPSGAIVTQTPAMTASQMSDGIWVK